MATYYISTTGDDTTGDGSSSNPWATLQKFLTASAENDTLIVKDGTYTITENIDITQRIIQAENNGLAIFDGDSTIVAFFFFSDNVVTGMVFQNFYVRLDSANGIFASRTTASSTTYNNCIWRNNRLAQTTSFQRGPIFSGRDSNTCLLYLNNCVFYGNYLNASNGTKSTYIGGGLSVYMTNNTLVNDNTDGLNIQNVFYSQSAGGFGEVDIKNSIIYNSSSATLNLIDSTNKILDFTTSYTDYYEITGAYMTEALASTGVITSDPLFIDEANNNYNLSPSSPCIDAGTLI
jgi:hypothetical protein